MKNSNKTPLDTFKEFPFDREKLSGSHKGKDFRTYLNDIIVTESCLKPVLEYLMKRYSANMTAQILTPILGYRVCASIVINWCSRLGVPTHSFSEAAKLPSCRKLHETTNIERYGAPNTFCKDTITYKKKVQTVLDKYGVDNIRKSKEFQETRKNTMLQKYGVTNSVFLPTYERCTGRRSKIQKRVESWLSEIGVSFECEVPEKFRSFNETLQREYSPIVDILIEDRKVVIEVYGDRWHANPKIYKRGDIISRWDGEVSAEHVWTVDKAREDQIRSFGYSFYSIWEDDIRFHEDKVKSFLERFRKKQYL